MFDLIFGSIFVLFFDEIFSSMFTEPPRPRALLLPTRTNAAVRRAGSRLALHLAHLGGLRAGPRRRQLLGLGPRASGLDELPRAKFILLAETLELLFCVVAVLRLLTLASPKLVLDSRTKLLQTSRKVVIFTQVAAEERYIW